MAKEGGREFDWWDDHIRDECGVIGVYGVDDPAAICAAGALNLQQRGHDGFGIETSSTRRFYGYRGLGLVGDVMADVDTRTLRGHKGIGHVRYGTQGGQSIRNVQPYVNEDELAVAINGQFANCESMRRELEKRASFATSSDSELPLHTWARSSATSIEDKIVDTFVDLEPSYSGLLLTKKHLVAVRDPCGYRPLVRGSLDGKPIFASETVALDILGATYEGEVMPGQAVIVSDRGIDEFQFQEPRKSQNCIFELIYFSRPDSFLFGLPVTASMVREEFGRDLYNQKPVEADYVVPVLDSGVSAANGFSQESGIPLEIGLVRNHFVQRSFISHNQRARELGVRIKHNVNPSYVKDKRIVLVDDSIVRGTTSKRIVKLLRDAGAKEIHFRVSSPPYKHPCFYGIDTPHKRNLIAAHKPVSQIKDMLGVDSLVYLSEQRMFGNKHLQEIGPFCGYCFNGRAYVKKS